MRCKQALGPCRDTVPSGEFLQVTELCGGGGSGLGAARACSRGSFVSCAGDLSWVFFRREGRREPFLLTAT